MRRDRDHLTAIEVDPNPPTPLPPSQKPKLRQTTQEPKRVDCLGLFFVASSRMGRGTGWAGERFRLRPHGNGTSSSAFQTIRLILEGARHRLACRRGFDLALSGFASPLRVRRMP
jgi:hypothetical protein